MSVSLLPMAAFAAEEPVTSYLLWVGDVQVTSDNMNNIPGVTGGTATYNPDSGVLAMNGITGIEGSHNNAKIYSEADLTITGSCMIDASGVTRGIYTTADLTLDGDIEVKDAVDLSVYVDGSKNITINGGIIKISSDTTRYGLIGGNYSKLTIKAGDIIIESFGSDDYGNGNGIDVGSFYMQDGKLSVTGYAVGLFSYYFSQTGGSIYAEGKHKPGVLVGNGSSPDLYIKGELESVTWSEDRSAIQSYRSSIRINSNYYIKEPADASIVNDGNGQIIVNSNQTNAGHVIITKKPTPYDLWIAGTQVTSANAGDLTVIDGVDVADGGKASYDAETNTLTLENATLGGAGYPDWRHNNSVITIAEREPGIKQLTVAFSGDNKIECEFDGTSGYNYYNGICGVYTDFIFDGDDDATLTISGRLTMPATPENGALCCGSITLNGGTVLCQAPEEECANPYDTNPYGVGMNNSDGVTLTVNGGKLISKAFRPLVPNFDSSKLAGNTVLRGSVNYDGTELESYNFNSQNSYRYVEATPAVPVTSYLLWVGDVQVTSDNLTIDSSDCADVVSGSATYDPDTRTLALDGFVYSGAGSSSYPNTAINYLETGRTLTLDLTGENRVTLNGARGNEQFGIYCDTDSELIIQGGGSLYSKVIYPDFPGTYAYTYGIYGGKVTINGGTVTAEGFEAPNSFGIRGGVSGVEVNGGSLTAIAGQASNRSYGVDSALVVNGGTVVAKTISTGPDAKALSGAPTLGEGVTATASMNPDGSGAEKYSADHNSSYKWFKAQSGEPAPVLTIVKNWSDNGDAAGKRPDSIDVMVKAVAAAEFDATYEVPPRTLILVKPILFLSIETDAETGDQAVVFGEMNEEFIGAVGEEYAQACKAALESALTAAAAKAAIDQSAIGSEKSSSLFVNTGVTVTVGGNIYPVWIQAASEYSGELFYIPDVYAKDSEPVAVEAESWVKDGDTWTCEMTLPAGVTSVEIWESAVPDGYEITGNGSEDDPAAADISGDTTVTLTNTLIPDAEEPVIPVSYAYNVETPENENGSVTVKPSPAEAGDTVTVTAEPNEGYEVDKITVTDNFGNEIPVKRNDDGTYSFTMPDGPVKVTAEFKETDHSLICPSKHFSDVDPDAWYHESVDYVVENGLMNGISDELFDPAGTVTRGMVVTILYSLEGEPAVSGPSHFFDVSTEAPEWYTDAVLWASENGIVEGYIEGPHKVFGPNAPITREQFAAILYRYEQYKGGGFVGDWYFLLEYEDADQISDWADEAMHWCVMKGIIKGCTETTLVPKGEASRAEAAAIIMRYIESGN